jgi:hypothetical protein
MRTVKRLALPVVLAAAAIAALLALRPLCTREGGPAFAPSGLQAAVPPPGWTVLPEERTSSFAEEFNPFHRPTRADEAMREWPAGSRLVHVETEGGEEVEIGIVPGGEVAAPEGRSYEVTVYHKPESAVALELRPFVGAGLGTSGPAVMGGVDVVRAWRFHLGPAVAVSLPDREVAAGGAVAYNLWRNVDLCLAGGYGTAGGFGAAGVTVAIE